ncbi:MAG: zinc-binding dehydrogenase [Bacteroidales bacterium]|nr:zinc-binding dehydrogenase [Bacteroidales bacterium]
MKKNSIPEKMQAIVLPAYNQNIIRALLSLKVEEKDIPKPKNGQVLIQMSAAPCNPSDIAFMQGGYNIVKTLACVPGFEGSGIVVDTGNDKVSKNLLGKKVSCFTQDDRDGTWAEFFLTETNNCIILKDEIDMDQAACLAINPITAFGLFEIALQRESQAIIQNGAGSQLCRFISALAKKHKIKVINLVRKKEVLNQLKKEGEEFVLLSTDENFTENLSDLANQLNATTAFDAVGGETTGLIFNAMPKDSEVIVYGGLSGKSISEVNVMELIFKDKILSGFNLNEWIEEIGTARFNEISNELQEMIIKNEISTKIAGKFKLEEVIKGIRKYIGNMSGGKILFITKK